MKVLLDTNVLLRHSIGVDRFRAAISAALDVRVSRGEELCVCPQNIVELWAVATRPSDANLLGIPPAQLRKELELILPAYTLLPDPLTLFSRWLELCAAHEVRGRQVYDARIAAFMIESGLTAIITLNPTDFTRFPGIQTAVPGA